MKLYTEEQVRHLADCIHGADTEKILASLTPIELPSDEEIEKTAKEKYIGLSRDIVNYRGCFEQGAKMVINKIQGRNK